jgi:hypothetical protein
MADFSNEILEALILEGAAEVAGMDMDTGEMLYSFTSKLNEVSPEIYTHVTTIFYETVMSLWEKGFLDMDLTKKEPIVTLSDKAFDLDEVEKLVDLERRTLDSVIDQFKAKE